MVVMQHRGATHGELLRELTVIMARSNGLIAESAALAWAHDLEREGLSAADVRAAGLALGRHIAAPKRGSLRGRVQLEDIVDLARRARTARLRGGPALALAATNERDPADVRAGEIVSRLIVRALARDPQRFARVPPEALTARQNALREQIAEVIRAEPQVTDAELMRRFGGAT